MEFNTCFKINTIFFKVKDNINNKLYIFLGYSKKIDPILNKVNNSKLKSLSKQEKDTLNDYIKNSNIKLSDFTENTILLPCQINLFDSIDIIKKKIMKFINKNSIPSEQFIWLKKKNIILGFEFISESKEKLQIDTDILKDNYNPEDIDTKYSYRDTNNELFSTYNFEMIDTLNFINYEDYYNKYKQNKNFEKIKVLYFPNLNKQSISYNDYENIIDSIVNSENKFYSSYHELNDKYKFKECLLKNIVIKNTQTNLNLQDIFTKLNVNSKIVFIKYRTVDKNQFFKVYTKPFNTKKVYKNYTNYKNYIIPYEKGFHDQIIRKTELEKWSQKTISFKEKQYFKQDKDLEIERKYNSYIVIKIHWKYNIYYEVEIKENELFIRLLMDDYYVNTNDILELVENTNVFIKDINKIISKKIEKLTTNNIKFVCCDSANMINLKNINISKLKDYLKYYLFFFYKYEPEYKNKNTLYCKYKLVDNFSSFENIKRHFIKLKKSNPQLSISDFKKEWITECKNMFNLSDSDALDKLTQITEIVSQSDLNSSQIDIDVDISFTKKVYDSDSELYIYELSVNNCTNLYTLEIIKNLISVILSDFLEVKKVEKQVVEESKIEVKQLVIKDEEEAFDLELDLELDLDLNNNINDIEEEEEQDNKDSKNDIEDDIDIEEMLQKKNEEIEDEDDKKYVELNEDFFKGKSHTIRNYMADMRLLDQKLFKFEDENSKSYSKKCQSVQMKQPIIITKTGLRNIEKRNPDAYKVLTKLEWGSSKKSKNFYICPKIWCIRDKLVLLPKDLVRNNQGELSCRFCKGLIIDSESKKIEDNRTVIIRKAATNDYWENPTLRNKNQPKELDGSEQHAFPSLLPPNVHPNGFCMPCCNKSRSWNFNKCMLVNVDYTTNNRDIQPSDLLPGSILDGNELIEDDTVLLKNTENFNNIYIVTKAGGQIKKDLTPLEIKIKSGMIVTINKGKYKGEQYKIIIDNLITEIIRKKNSYDKGNWTRAIDSEVNETQLKIKGFEDEGDQKSLEVDDTLKIIHNSKIYKNKEYKILSASYNDNYIIIDGDIDIDLSEGLTLWELSNIRFLKLKGIKLDKYVLSADKFPLGENKLGILSDELDFKLNKNNKGIEKSRIVNNAKLFLRRGINQQPNVSFINSIASILDMPYTELIKKVIENITPELFLSLNNGEIYKMFTKSHEEIDETNINYQAFIKWCYEYSDFSLFFNKLNFNSESEFLSIIKEKKNIQSEKREVLEQMVQYFKNNKITIFKNFKYKLLMNIYKSFENYKKFWGDLNINKEPELVLDLLSRNNLWLNKDYNGLNIIILEQKKDKIYVNCPITENINNIYDTKKSYCLIYKYRGIYEPIIIVNEVLNKNTKQRDLLQFSYFNNKIKYNKYLLNIVNTLYKLTVLNCVSKINSELYSIYDKIKYENLNSLNKTITFFKSLKNEKFNPKNLLIDSYFKGIGIILNNNFIVFTANFGIDKSKQYDLDLIGINNISLLDFDKVKMIIKDINKEINLEKQRKNLKIKKIEKSKLNKDLVSTKINKLIKEITDMPSELQIQNIIIKNNMIVAVVLSNGLFHPLKQENYEPNSKHKMKVSPLDLNYYLDINIGDSTVENDSVSFNYNYYRNKEKYSCFKNQYKAFLNSKNKNITVVKEHIYGIIDNPVILLSRKRELLIEIIMNISDTIIQKIDFDNNIIYNKSEVCYLNSNDACSKNSKTSACFYKKQNSNSNKTMIKLDGNELFFNVSKCKLKLEEKDISLFIYKLVAELLNSYKERINILENSSLDMIYDSSVILSDNFNEEIEKLYEKKNIYISSLLTKSMQNKDNILKNSEISSNLIDVLKDEDESKDINLKDLDPSKYDLDKLAKMFPPPIDNNSGDNLVVNIEEKICDSDKIATTIATKSRIDKKDDPMVKAGPCCFPFKDIGQGTKLTEFNDWKDKMIDGKREPICATSVFTEDENSEKKNHIKTYGFAPEGTVLVRKKQLKIKETKQDAPISSIIKKKKIKPVIIDTNNSSPSIERKTINGNDCKIPFFIETGRGKEKQISKKDNCIIEEVKPNKKNVGEWCPIKLDENRFILSKNKRELGVDYDYCEDTETLEKIKKDPKWSGPFEKTILADVTKSSNTINSKPIRTLKEAIEKCLLNEECIGISHDMLKNNYTLRKYNVKLTPDSSGKRITDKHRKDAEKWRSFIKN